MKVNGYEIKPGADLYGADLRDANLEGADLRDAILSPDMIWKFSKQLSTAKNLDKIILRST